MATIHKWLIGATVATAGGATAIYFEDLGLKSTFLETFETVSQKFSYPTDKSKYCKIVLTSEDKNNEILLCGDSDKENLRNKVIRNFGPKRIHKRENIKNYYAGVGFVRNKSDNSLRQFTQLASEESGTYFKKPLSEFDGSGKKGIPSRNILANGGVNKMCYRGAKSCYEEIGDYFYLNPFTKGFKFPTTIKQERSENRDQNLKVYLHPEEFLEKEHVDFKDIKRDSKYLSLIHRKDIQRLNSEADYQLIFTKDSPYNEFGNAGGENPLEFELAGLKKWEIDPRQVGTNLYEVSKAFYHLAIDFMDMTCSDKQSSSGGKRVLNCQHKDFSEQD